jgi:hypothetical protein
VLSLSPRHPYIDQSIFGVHQAFLDVAHPFDAKDSLTWRIGQRLLALD